MNPKPISRVGVVSYVVRKSMFFPVINILILQFIILVLMLSVKPFVEFINQTFKFSWSVEDFRTWSITLLQFLNVGMIFYFLLGWLYTYYIVRPHEVIYRKGLLLEQRLDYRFNHISKIDVRQSSIGKLLDYGTIRIYTTEIKEDAAFADIPQPNKYAAAILRHVGTDISIRSKPYMVSTTV